jgi:hypothetical protein
VTVARNPDGTYTVALGPLEQRVVNRVALWWEGPTNGVPPTDADVVRVLLAAALDRARKRLTAMDAGAVANAYETAPPATRATVEAALGVTPLS